MTAEFIVLSKCRSYMCAGRPTLAAIPSETLAARTISGAECGIVVGPSHSTGFRDAAQKLDFDPGLRLWFGEAGRRYAEAHFSDDVASARFMGAITDLLTGTQVARSWVVTSGVSPVDCPARE